MRRTASSVPVALRCPNCGHQLLTADMPVAVLPAVIPGPAALARLLGVKEAAKQLGISRSTLYGLLGRGELRPIRVGRRVLISITELERFVGEGSS
jgi:excisionase family DNA binding protein